MRGTIIQSAHQAVVRARKRGTLKRPTACSVCHKTCNPVGHHDDYTKALDVRWMCVPCHSFWHMHNTAIGRMLPARGRRKARPSKILAAAERLEAKE